MEIYLYCSYEHSQKGYFMTQLIQNQLIPVQTPPPAVHSFFSYDRFSLLWYDTCENQTLRNPIPTGAFWGLRNIRGVMADGRNATANLVFLADAKEITWLRRIALTVLADYPAFQRQFVSWLNVGGDSYTLDTDGFNRFLESCAQVGQLRRLADARSVAAQLLPWMQRTTPPKKLRELLHLGVYTSSWQDIQAVMGPGKVWRKMHPCLLSHQEFVQAFIRPAPLWSLEK